MGMAAWCSKPKHRPRLKLSLACKRMACVAMRAAQMASAANITRASNSHQVMTALNRRSGCEGQPMRSIGGLFALVAKPTAQRAPSTNIRRIRVITRLQTSLVSLRQPTRPECHYHLIHLPLLRLKCWWPQDSWLAASSTKTPRTLPIWLVDMSSHNNNSRLH